MAKRNRKPAPKPATGYGKILIQSGVVVPALFGVGLGTALVNIVVGIILGLACGVAYWMFFAESFKEKQKNVTKKKTADDIVLNVLENTAFVTAEPTDEMKRPEAYSLDGLRWSHKLTFTDEDGNQDIYVIRGSLETGEGYLEFVEDESEHPIEYWDI